METTGELPAPVNLTCHVVGGTAVGTESMFKGGDGSTALCAGMTQGTPTPEAVVGMHMKPHGVWLTARFPALWTKLEHTGLFDGNSFAGCL